jgi:uncharacterized membrane protein YphA (DoxX/SURF4 family)
VDFLILVGRVMFGLVFIASALGHLTQTVTMANYIEARGTPNAYLLTRVSGVGIALGAVSVMIGIFGDLGALLLFLFLLATSFTVHTFWREPEGEARSMVQTQFMKDLALAGAALVLFGVFVEFGDALGFTLTGPAL